MAETTAQQMLEMWRKQMEEGTQAWLKLVSQAPVAPQTMDPQAFWKPFADQGIAAWSRIMTQGPVSPDLMKQWKEFVDQWIAAWAKVLEQAMGTEAFARALGKQLESFLSAASPAKKAAEQQIEQTMAGLGLASRAQVASLAKQVIQVEEKIETVEDQVGAVLRRLDELVTVLSRDRR
jgi:hypothetical protein